MLFYYSAAYVAIGLPVGGAENYDAKFFPILRPLGGAVFSTTTWSLRRDFCVARLLFFPSAVREVRVPHRGVRGDSSPLQATSRVLYLQFRPDGSHFHRLPLCLHERGRSCVRRPLRSERAGERLEGDPHLFHSMSSGHLRVARTVRSSCGVFF